jgi:hypothetical protein
VKDEFTPLYSDVVNVRLSQDINALEKAVDTRQKVVSFGFVAVFNFIDPPGSGKRALYDQEPNVSMLLLVA